MALSGSISTGVWTSSTGNNTWKVVLNWTATQDINNNTSTISWNLKVSSTSSSLYVVISELRVKFAGEQIYYRSSSKHTNGYDNTTLASGTKVITHNNDGTKSFTATVEAGIFDHSINKSGSGTIALNTIPRSSTITSASNITLGNSCSIKWTPASSDFKYKINFALGNWSYTTDYISPKTTSEYTYSGYTISGTTKANNTTIYEQLASSTSGTMTATLTTYNSSNTQIGSSSSKTFTVTVPTSSVPTIGSISITPASITAADGSTISNTLVQGQNKLTINVSGCSAGDGSTIKSYTFSGPNVSSTINSSSSSASLTSSSTISSSGDLTYTVQVTDARGRTATTTAQIKCYEYSAPSFLSFSAYRCDSSGNVKENGTCIKYSLGVKYSSVNNTNKSTIKIYYKKGSDNSWTAAANACTNSTTTSFENILIKNSSGSNISFDSNTTYLIRATVIDNYNTSTDSSNVTIFGEERTFNIRPNGSGLALGKMAEEDNLFECKWNAKFNGTASGPSGFSTSSDMRVKSNIEDIDIDVVDQLRPIQYTLTRDVTGKIHYGFIAQDIETLWDSIGLDPNSFGIIGHINNGGEQEYVLTYTEFIPLLTKKCQILQNEINVLRSEIENLKNNIK